MFRRLLLRVTHRVWNREISRILCQAYESHVLSSAQLHELAAAFDPTQEHKVYGKHRDTPFAFGLERRAQILKTRQETSDG